VHFREDVFGPGFLESPELQGVRKLLTRARRGIRFTGNTQDTVRSLLLGLRSKSGLGRAIAFLQVLQVLECDKHYHILSSQGFTPELDAFASERINHAYHYIFKNFSGPIDYGAIARGVGMSLSGFSHYFRRATGRTVSEVVNEVRVGHANRLLMETQRTVSEVAYACGFGSLSNFNRCFRRITGVSPRQYRAKHQT
jgi:transcriptional regulator GlxA family with amidase domain